MAPWPAWAAGAFQHLRMLGLHGSDQTARLTLPTAAKAGQRVVLNLTATDNGEHTLTSYGRVVFVVR